jgi:hypothetical protein
VLPRQGAWRLGGLDPRGRHSRGLAVDRWRVERARICALDQKPQIYYFSLTRDSTCRIGVSAASRRQIARSMEGSMAGIRIFNIHRTWEEWFGIGLGVLIGLSPWITGQENNSAISWNAVLVGLLVVLLNGLELVDLHRWEETGQIALGVWLIASPFVFAYGGALAYWHYALGAALVLLAVLELWQDRRLSDGDMARYGH